MAGTITQQNSPFQQNAGVTNSPKRGGAQQTLAMLRQKQLQIEFKLEGTPYNPVQNIGTGAYGVVCSAIDSRSDRKVAIKKINKAFGALTLIKRTLREVQILRHFRHENIVCVLDMFHADGMYGADVYMVMDLMETDLHQIIHSRQTLTEQHLQYFMYQILRGLKYIHSAGVIHRDLKPSNLLVNADCLLKIGDFGMARSLGQNQQSLGVMTQYVATRWYRAPELVFSLLEYTTAVDLWSVGCIFAELIMRRQLFPGKDHVSQLKLIVSFLGTPEQEIMDKISSDIVKRLIQGMGHCDPLPWSTILPKASPEALDLCIKMMELAPWNRIDAEDSLKHEYLEPYHDPEQEPVCSKQVVVDTEMIESLSPAELKSALEQAVTQFTIVNSQPSSPTLSNNTPKKESSAAGDSSRRQSMIEEPNNNDNKSTAFSFSSGSNKCRTIEDHQENDNNNLSDSFSSSTTTTNQVVQPQTTQESDDSEEEEDGEDEKKKKKNGRGDVNMESGRAVIGDGIDVNMESGKEDDSASKRNNNNNRPSTIRSNNNNNKNDNSSSSSASSSASDGDSSSNSPQIMQIVSAKMESAKLESDDDDGKETEQKKTDITMNNNIKLHSDLSSSTILPRSHLIPERASKMSVSERLAAVEAGGSIIMPTTTTTTMKTNEREEEEEEEEATNEEKERPSSLPSSNLYTSSLRNNDDKHRRFHHHSLYPSAFRTDERPTKDTTTTTAAMEDDNKSDSSSDVPPPPKRVTPHHHNIYNSSSSTRNNPSSSSSSSSSTAISSSYNNNSTTDSNSNSNTSSSALEAERIGASAFYPSKREGGNGSTTSTSSSSVAFRPRRTFGIPKSDDSHHQKMDDEAEAETEETTPQRDSTSTSASSGLSSHRHSTPSSYIQRRSNNSNNNDSKYEDDSTTSPVEISFYRPTYRAKTIKTIQESPRTSVRADVPIGGVGSSSYRRSSGLGSNSAANPPSTSTTTSTSSSGGGVSRGGVGSNKKENSEDDTMKEQRDLVQRIFPYQPPEFRASFRRRSPIKQPIVTRTRDRSTHDDDDDDDDEQRDDDDNDSKQMKDGRGRGRMNDDNDDKTPTKESSTSFSTPATASKASETVVESSRGRVGSSRWSSNNAPRGGTSAAPAAERSTTPVRSSYSGGPSVSEVIQRLQPGSPKPAPRRLQSTQIHERRLTEESLASFRRTAPSNASSTSSTASSNASFSTANTPEKPSQNAGGPTTITTGNQQQQQQQYPEVKFRRQTSTDYKPREFATCYGVASPEFKRKDMAGNGNRDMNNETPAARSSLANNNNKTEPIHSVHHTSAGSSTSGKYRIKQTPVTAANLLRHSQTTSSSNNDSNAQHFKEEQQQEHKPTVIEINVDVDHLDEEDGAVIKTVSKNINNASKGQSSSSVASDAARKTMVTKPPAASNTTRNRIYTPSSTSINTSPIKVTQYRTINGFGMSGSTPTAIVRRASAVMRNKSPAPKPASINENRHSTIITTHHNFGVDDENSSMIGGLPTISQNQPIIVDPPPNPSLLTRARRTLSPTKKPTSTENLSAAAVVEKENSRRSHNKSSDKDEKTTSSSSKSNNLKAILRNKLQAKQAAKMMKDDADGLGSSTASTTTTKESKAGEPVKAHDRRLEREERKKKRDSKKGACQVYKEGESGVVSEGDKILMERWTRMEGESEQNKLQGQIGDLISDQMKGNTPKQSGGLDSSNLMSTWLQASQMDIETLQDLEKEIEID